MKHALAPFLFLLVFCLVAREGCAQQAPVPQTQAQLSMSFAPLLRQVTPAVVNIYTRKLVKQRVSPFFNDPFFQQFFGGGLPHGMTRERMENSLGSGVIIRADGMIVTSRHVIADASEIRVVLSDRREFDAKILIQDERSDLAILRIETNGEVYPFLDLRDSDEAQVGDIVLAIGNPFGVGQTVTMGIVSAVTHKAVGAGDLGAFIQTDAAINPGNSGGALITADGKLIGINASIFSRSGGNMGIGFAVPSNMVRLMMNAAIQGKTRLTHPWVGIDGQDLTQDIALSLGLTQPTGILVRSIHPASPAAKSGLKQGDVIFSVNGRDIENTEAFRYRTTALEIGSTAELGIVRNGRRQTMRMPLIAPPEIPERNETLIRGQNPAQGATIANLSPALAEEIGLISQTTGVVVTNVTAGSIAARIGLASMDIIVAINGETVTDVDAVVALFKAKPRSWRLTIRRGGNEITMMVGG